MRHFVWRKKVCSSPPPAPTPISLRPGPAMCYKGYNFTLLHIKVSSGLSSTRMTHQTISADIIQTCNTTPLHLHTFQNVHDHSLFSSEKPDLMSNVTRKPQELVDTVSSIIDINGNQWRKKCIQKHKGTCTSTCDVLALTPSKKVVS